VALVSSNIDRALPFETPSQGFIQLTKTHISLLRTAASVARALVSDHLSDENFQRLVKFAHDLKIVSAEKLGEIGRVDRTTASRWVNGHSAPSPLSQEAILHKIAEEAKIQATRLNAQLPRAERES
jgi:hypothetical protein